MPSTVKTTLETYGVSPYAPSGGDPFDPRWHRRVGTVETGDPRLSGRVATVNRDGYQDVEIERPIAPAEVAVYVFKEEEENVLGVDVPISEETLYPFVQLEENNEA